MHRNHLVWAEIESITARYQMTDSDGKTTPDTEKQIIARRSLLALRNFFLKNNLLANKKTNTRDKNIERNFYFNDFTEEGIELLKQKVPSWLDSKSAQKNPPDMKSLERALTAIRSNKIAK